MIPPSPSPRVPISTAMRDTAEMLDRLDGPRRRVVEPLEIVAAGQDRGRRGLVEVEVLGRAFDRDVAPAAQESGDRARSAIASSQRPSSRSGLKPGRPTQRPARAAPRHRRDRDRRRVRRDDAPAVSASTCAGCELEREILGRRLDHEVAAGEVVVRRRGVRRASAASRSAAASFSFLTRRSRLPPTAATPRSRRVRDVEHHDGTPEVAHACAMPLPIVPAPMTPTLSYRPCPCRRFPRNDVSANRRVDAMTAAARTAADARPDRRGTCRSARPRCARSYAAARAPTRA